MARIALACPDLLFGSKIEGALAAAGHEVSYVRDEAGAAGGDLLVADLNAEELDAVELLGQLREAGERVPALGFYAHTDVETRRRAEACGFELVVPRSRMAREGVELAERLLAARAS